MEPIFKSEEEVLEAIKKYMTNPLSEVFLDKVMLDTGIKGSDELLAHFMENQAKGILHHVLASLHPDIIISSALRNPDNKALRECALEILDGDGGFLADDIEGIIERIMSEDVYMRAVLDNIQLDEYNDDR